MTKQSVAKLLFLAAVGVSTLAAHAQTTIWPSRPIRLIVAAPPGLPPDVLARGLAQQMEKQLGQPVAVENRPGASQIIGAQSCSNAPPDGHTLCVLLSDAVSLNPHLFNKLPYDPEKGFSPVAILGWPQSAIVVNSATGLKSLKEVIDASKASPGTFNFASHGNGSLAHLYLEWIRSSSGWDVTHIPYNTSPLQAALGGQVQLTYLAVGALKPHIDSGKLTAIAVAGIKRSPLLPDVPTFAEAGLEATYPRTWFGLFAPAGTPSAITEKLNKLAVSVVNDASFKTRVMDPMTISPGHETIPEMTQLMKSDRELGLALVKRAKVKLD